MTIDLSKLKAGDAVKFRCGGEAVVSLFEPSKQHEGLFYLMFNGYNPNYGCDYSPCGGYNAYYHSGVAANCPFDIIEIITAPFDWADAKQGMAFVNTNGNEYYYVAQDFNDFGMVVVAGLSKCDDFYSLWKTDLTRAPEHDLEIAK